MKKIVLLSSLFVLLSNVSFAKQDGFESFFDSEIFSLSKKKEDSFDAPSASYIVTSEDIRRSGATSIPEALRLVPGLQVARINGNQWAISARGFNAQYSNKLLVLIDGRVVYTQIFSGVVWDIHDYVLEDIDRIEVVRGPGGTIWGANAVNGIINIITKNAAQTQGFYASQIAGNKDKSITELRYGGQTSANNDYRLYAKKSVREGFDKYSDKTENDDGFRQDRAGFRYDITSIEDNKVSISGDIFSGVALSYFPEPQISNNNRNDRNNRGGNTVVNWNRKLSNKSNFTLNSYFDYDKFETPILSRAARTYDLDFQHFYSFSKENQFIWGLGYNRVDDNIRETSVSGTTQLDYTPNNLSSYVYSGFIQDKIGLVPDKLYLTLGSKFLINNFTGFEYQPNAKLAFYPARNQTLWASVSRAVRTPTRGEDGLVLLNGFQQGDTNYESENLMAYELGYRIKPVNNLMFDISTFYNDYNDLRTFESVGSNQSRANNDGKGKSYGFEFVAEWQANDKLKLEFDYEFLKTNLGIAQHSTDDTTSSNLQLAEGASPQNQFKIKALYNLSSKIEFDNYLFFVDELKTGTASSTNGPGHIPSHVRFDTRVGYLYSRNLDFSFGIQNLFDQRHSEFRAGLFNRRVEIGRTFYVKAVWQY